MDSIDISALVVGSPPHVFHSNYYSQPPSSEFEQMKRASESGDIQQIRVLVESQKLSPDELNYSLTLAQQKGSIDIAAYLLSHGASVQTFHFEMAVKERSYPFLTLFLDHGYDLNRPINWSTPSALIFSFDDDELCKWLLERGADPNARCVLDLTPLSVVVQEASFSMIELLFKHGGSIEHGQLLHYAVRREKADYLRVLAFVLAKGPSVNRLMYENHRESFELQKPFGVGTPLHEAAGMGKLHVVDMLLSRGAHPWVKDVRGLLAVDHAVLNNQTAVVERLRRLG